MKRDEKKKTYETPRLKVHGTLGKLTKAKGGLRSDGVGKPKTKTGGPA